MMNTSLRSRCRLLLTATVQELPRFFQDYGLGSIVGTTTYGKGIVQQIFDLGDGTCVKLTMAEYYTPNGRNIHKKGITPDVEVEYQRDENHPNADNQLDAALEQVRNKINQ